MISAMNTYSIGVKYLSQIVPIHLQSDKEEHSIIQRSLLGQIGNSLRYATSINFIYYRNLRILRDLLRMDLSETQTSLIRVTI